MGHRDRTTPNRRCPHRTDRANRPGSRSHAERKGRWISSPSRWIGRSAASLKATYRALLARGLEAGEAANLTAFLHGLPAPASAGPCRRSRRSSTAAWSTPRSSAPPPVAGRSATATAPRDPAIDHPAHILSVRLHPRHRPASRLTPSRTFPASEDLLPSARESRKRRPTPLGAASYLPGGGATAVRFDTIRGPWLPKRPPNRERPVIGFLTDFGLDGAAAICRGVMLVDRARCPDRRHQPHRHEVRDPRRRLPAGERGPVAARGRPRGRRRSGRRHGPPADRAADGARRRPRRPGQRAAAPGRATGSAA